MSEIETVTPSTAREDDRHLFGNDNYLQKVEAAKHEDYLLDKLISLQKAGLLWSRRLPKAQDPIRIKTHWDFLLGEVTWMCVDFVQERKWKKAAAQKLSRSTLKYFQDKALAAQRAQKEHERHKRQGSGFVAKLIKDFWNNVEKLVIHKRLIIIAETHKKELNQKLSVIVNQTEQYSHNIAKYIINKSTSTIKSHEDDDVFLGSQTDGDSKETIEQEEIDLSMADKAEEMEYLPRETENELDVDSSNDRDNIRLCSDDSDDEILDVESEGSKSSSSENETLDKLKSAAKCNPSDEQDKLINDAEAIAETMKPNGSYISSNTVLTKVPFLLKLPLREYQHIGLDWLVTMYERQLNGILADEMGLGKTIQTIALLAYLACEKRNWGPHLIVVPTSILLNWEMELKKWCPGFKILCYYGSQAERKQKRVGWAKINTFHVCITSYNLVIQDHQSFRRKKWKYLILDEAQNIKNFKSERWKLLLNFQTERRLLLTGTPLQNNLMELWSLMHFLMPDVFQSHREFKEWFSNPVSGMLEGNTEYNENIIRRLHKVLRPFLLRRLKSEVEKQMPKKYEHIIMCRLSKRQRSLYDDYMCREKTQESLAGGNLLRVINILMQLRKVCNHPNLFEDRPVISPFQCDNYILPIPSIVYSALEYDINKHVSLQALNLVLILLEMQISLIQFYHCSRTINKPISQQIASCVIRESAPPRLPPCKFTMRVIQTSKEGAKENIASQQHNSKAPGEEKEKAESMGCNEIMDLCFPQQSKANYCDNSEDNTNQEQFHDDDLVNKLRINERRCMAEPLYGKDFRDACKIFRPNKTVEWTSGRLYCLNVLYDKNYMEPTRFLKEALYNPTRRIEELEDILDRFILYIPAVNSKGPEIRACRLSPSQLHANQQQRYILRKIFSKPALLLHNIASAMTCQFPDARLIQYDCGKLQKLAELLRKLKHENHRVLIFTQMTKMLDVLEIFLNYHGYNYLRMDGTTKIDQRQTLLDRFNNNQKIFVFILSTRSGGVGINLTGADTVIFYDSDWNPTMDAQAQDRCHRIGQTRDVHIYRLISEKTIEENILKKANQKQLLGNLAIEGGKFTTAYFTNIADLFNIDQTLDTAEKRIGERTSDIGSILDVKSKNYEKALAACEDVQDFQAAELAKAEVIANLSEFDESVSFKCDDAGKNEKEISKEQQEIDEIIEKLSPIEKYALRFIEQTSMSTANILTTKTKKQMDLQKRLWEIHEKNETAAKKKDLRQKEIEENENMLTYSLEDSKKEWICQNTKEIMPIYCPFPQDSDNIYKDPTTSFLYDSEAKPDLQLTPPYVKKTNKRHQEDSFDSPSPKIPKTDLSNAILSRNRVPPWTECEDRTLLSCIEEFQKWSWDLKIKGPGRRQNWNFVADHVNSISIYHRTARQCEERYNSKLLQTEKIGKQWSGQDNLPLINRMDCLKKIRNARVSLLKNNSNDNSLLNIEDLNENRENQPVAHQQQKPPTKSLLVKESPSSRTKMPEGSLASSISPLQLADIIIVNDDKSGYMEQLPSWIGMNALLAENVEKQEIPQIKGYQQRQTCASKVVDSPMRMKCIKPECLQGSTSKLQHIDAPSISEFDFNIEQMKILSPVEIVALGANKRTRQNENTKIQPFTDALINPQQPSPMWGVSPPSIHTIPFGHSIENIEPLPRAKIFAKANVHQPKWKTSVADEEEDYSTWVSPWEVCPPLFIREENLSHSIATIPDSHVSKKMTQRQFPCKEPARGAKKNAKKIKIYKGPPRTVASQQHESPTFASPVVKLPIKTSTQVIRGSLPQSIHTIPSSHVDINSAKGPLLSKVPSLRAETEPEKLRSPISGTLDAKQQHQSSTCISPVVKSPIKLGTQAIRGNLPQSIPSSEVDKSMEQCLLLPEISVPKVRKTTGMMENTKVSAISGVKPPRKISTQVNRGSGSQRVQTKTTCHGDENMELCLLPVEITAPRPKKDPENTKVSTITDSLVANQEHVAPNWASPEVPEVPIKISTQVIRDSRLQSMQAISSRIVNHTISKSHSPVVTAAKRAKEDSEKIENTKAPSISANHQQQSPVVESQMKTSSKVICGSGPQNLHSILSSHVGKIMKQLPVEVAGDTTKQKPAKTGKAMVQPISDTLIANQQQQASTSIFQVMKSPMKISTAVVSSSHPQSLFPISASHVWEEMDEPLPLVNIATPRFQPISAQSDSLANQKIPPLTPISQTAKSPMKISTQVGGIARHSKHIVTTSPVYGSRQQLSSPIKKAAPKTKKKPEKIGNGKMQPVKVNQQQQTLTQVSPVEKSTIKLQPPVIRRSLQQSNNSLPASRDTENIGNSKVQPISVAIQQKQTSARVSPGIKPPNKVSTQVVRKRNNTKKMEQVPVTEAAPIAKKARAKIKNTRSQPITATPAPASHQVQMLDVSHIVTSPITIQVILPAQGSSPSRPQRIHIIPISDVSVTGPVAQGLIFSAAGEEPETKIITEPNLPMISNAELISPDNVLSIAQPNMAPEIDKNTQQVQPTQGIDRHPTAQNVKRSYLPILPKKPDDVAALKGKYPGSTENIQSGRMRQMEKEKDQSPAKKKKKGPTQ